jgi:nicotinamidase-related amidase
MAEPTLDPRKTAVLFFDVLKHYFYEDGRLKPHTRDQVARFQQILDTARKLDMAVFYGNADHRADGADWATAITDQNQNRFVNIVGKPRLKPATVRGSGGEQVIDEIAPRDGDYIIRKHRWSTFQNTHMELSMRTAGLDTLLIAGGATDIGVAATAYQARDRDFNVVILRDACRASRPELDEYFMEHVFPRLGRVRTVDEAVALLQAGAKGQKTL